MKKTRGAKDFVLQVKFYREKDGRWLADIPALPGVTAYGRTRKQAWAAAQALALRLIAYHDRVTLGPVALKLLAEKTGLRRADL